MSTVVSITSSRENALKAFMRDRPVMAYILLSFSVTWMLADLPLILADNGFGILPITLPSDLFIMLGTALGMAGSAFWVTYVVEGRAGVTDLLRRYTRWQVKPIWYILVFFQALLFVAAAIVAGLNTVSGLLSHSKLIFTELLPAALSILVFGQLWEEIGLRGFLLPRIQPRYGAFVASLILASLQTVWHIPGFFFAGGVSVPGEELLITVPYLVTVLTQTLFASLILGIITTWMYNSTKGSVLLVILLHTFSNASIRLAIIHITDPLMLARVSGLVSLGWIVLAVCVLLFTRGKLGFQREG